MTATQGHFQLDADPLRLVILSELLAATDPATIATAIYALTDQNQYTDADKALVQELNKFKGEHADAAAIELAFPAAAQQDDAWAFNEATDTVWVVDSTTGLWKDTNVSTAPASIDNTLNSASTNAVTNQAISAAMANRLVSQVYPLPGDGALTSFNITHTMASVSSWHVRKRVDKEAISIKVVESNSTTAAVGPFATAPADSTLFELVVQGTVAIA